MFDFTILRFGDLHVLLVVVQATPYVYDSCSTPPCTPRAQPSARALGLACLETETTRDPGRDGLSRLSGSKCTPFWLHRGSTDYRLHYGFGSPAQNEKTGTGTDNLPTAYILATHTHTHTGRTPRDGRLAPGSPERGGAGAESD